MFMKYNQWNFEYKLKWALISTKAGFMEDYTEQWRKLGHETQENIYRVSTKNPAVDLIIFSSVDLRTHWTRENGMDAVRIIMRWKTQRWGYVYKRLAKHYRRDTLFNNIRKTLLLSKGQIFNLIPGEFTYDSNSVI